MAIALQAVGTVVSGIGATLTPTVAFSAGQQVVIWTWELRGSQTIATPAGLTQVDRNANSLQCRAFAFNSFTGSETLPGFIWGGGSVAGAVATAWSGMDSALGSGGSTPLDRNFNSTNSIIGPSTSYTPGADGSVVFLYGQRNKTSTTDGTIYTAPANFTMLVTSVPNLNNFSFALAYWIQTTATAIPINDTITGSKTEGTAQSSNSAIFSIQPALPVVPFPPTSLGGMNVQVCM